MDNRTLQRCEGLQCPAREQCHRHTAEWHPMQPGIADYSQVREFKASCARENCPKFIANKLSTNWQDSHE